MRAPRLLTERLILALPSVADAPALQAYTARNLEYHRPWSPPAPPDALTRAATLERIDTIRRDFNSGASVRLWLRLNTEPDGEFIGAVSLTEIVLGALRQCVLGYHLDQAYEGQGLMSEAARAALDYAFDELKLQRISASYMPSNERSGALLKRLGFVVEGYARDYLFIHDGFRDHVIAALVSPSRRT